MFIQQLVTDDRRYSSIHSLRHCMEMGDQIQTQNEALKFTGQTRGLVWAESGTEPRFAGRPNVTLITLRGT